jgi:predicted enzyme involved in methoxymalonyl-ACP biosynthesis
LPKLSIKVINDNKHTESIKLYAKSNQFKFKFTQNDDKFDSDAKSKYFEIHRENGENLGICSAITYTLSNDIFLIHNWAISCRYFEIGLEEFILRYIQNIANASKILINYQHLAYNQKVSELLAKYSDAFKNDDKNDIIEILFTNEISHNINKNTNLREI